VIYILSLFGKKKIDGKEASVPEKYSLKSIFQAIAKQLKEHAEAAQRNESRKKRQQPDFEKRSQPKTGVAIDTGKKEEITLELSAKNVTLLHKTAEVMEKVLIDDSMQKEDQKIALDEGGFESSFSLKSLRNAVVWSEILGPPVALKEKHRQ
jgi:hypothetical protein